MDSLARNCLELLQQKLQDTATEDDLGPGNDVQRADMCVTRQWMRAVLWRAALRFGVVIPAMNPVNIAKEFLSSVSMIPPAALESHGPTLVIILNWKYTFDSDVDKQTGTQDFRNSHQCC